MDIPFVKTLHIVFNNDDKNNIIPIFTFSWSVSSATSFAKHSPPQLEAKQENLFAYESIQCLSGYYFGVRDSHVVVPVGKPNVKWSLVV